MPKLPQPTAQGRPAIANLPDVSPQHFGARAFAEVEGFGQTLQRVGEHLQRQRDELDLIGKAGDYDIRLNALKSEILLDKNIEPPQRMGEFKKRADAFRQELNQDASPIVQRMLSVHAVKSLSRGLMEFQEADTKQRIDQQFVDTKYLSGQLAARAASASTPEEEQARRQELRDVWDRAEGSQLYPPEAVRVGRAHGLNQFWEQVAMQNPARIIGMVLGPADKLPGDMDPAMKSHYLNVAVNSLHTMQSLFGQKQSEADAAAKIAQTEKVNEFYSMALRGENVPPEWYEQNRPTLGSKFDEIAKAGLTLREKGGIGAEPAVVGAYEKSIFVDNNLDRARIFADTRLNRDQKRDLEAAISKRETELRTAAENPSYFANDAAYKNYEKQIRIQMGETSFLTIMKDADKAVLGQAIREFNSKVELESQTNKNWKAEVPAIAASVMADHWPRLSVGVRQPADWKGDAQSSLKQLSEQMMPGVKLSPEAQAALKTNPEYRRRATQILAYERFRKLRPVKEEAAKDGKTSQQSTIDQWIQRLQESVGGE